MGAEFGRVEDIEVEAEDGDAVGEVFEGVGAGEQAAAVLVHRFDRAEGGGAAVGDLRGGGVGEVEGALRAVPLRVAATQGAVSTPPGRARGGTLAPVRKGSVSRSRRKVRQAARSRS